MIVINKETKKLRKKEIYDVAVLAPERGHSHLQAQAAWPALRRSAIWFGLYSIRKVEC